MPSEQLRKKCGGPGQRRGGPLRRLSLTATRARRAVAGVALGLGAALAPAVALACDLALALAHDVSHSVSREEYALQTRGHAAAFRDPEVQALILEQGGIMVSLSHWSAAHYQEMKLPWRFLDSPAAIDAFADDLAATLQTVEGFGTALGDLLAFMTTVWDGPAAACGRRVLDISGDGEANEGQPVADARIALLSRDVTINGLAIRRREIPLNRGIYEYFRAQVIGGPGAFAMQARGFDDYARAFKKKLLRELSPPIVADRAAETPLGPSR